MQQRNFGIDLLRIVSMFMVVVLHVLGQGGILAGQPPFTPGYALSWLLEGACYCAVNCFGMISGYVSHKETLSAEKAFTTWAQAAFYSVGISILFKILLPTSVSYTSILRSFFPVITTKYWYFTAYFGLMFLAPFLNTLLRSLTLHRAKRLMAVLFFLFCALPTLTDSDVFHLRAGYTLAWLCTLYLFGGCIRKLGPDWGPRGGHCLLGYLLCVLLTVGSKALLGLYGPLREGILFSYTSPTILGSALFLLLLFRGLQIEHSQLKKGITFFAPLAFGVYLIHTHPLVWHVLLANRFQAYAAFSAPLCILLVLLSAGAIFFGCIMVEFVRARLFQRVIPPIFRLLHRPKE